MLIDCAEGTQQQLRRYKIHFQRIGHIFISHLHGDHFYGLAGLLSTFHLLGRKEELHLYANPELEDVLNALFNVSLTVLSFPFHFHPVRQDSFDLLFENEHLTVHSFPVIHSVPTVGFIFREKSQQRKLRKDMIGKLHIPVSEMGNIKRGAAFTDESGEIHSSEELTMDPPATRSYAYCSDTLYNESMIPFIQGSDLLYHEATFMQDRLRDAHEKMHATAMEAATIAEKAKVKKLIIGHFSARYEDVQPLLEEARTIFPETYAVEDGQKFTI